jgi:hypothetical protein
MENKYLDSESNVKVSSDSIEPLGTSGWIYIASTGIVKLVDETPLV